MNIDISQLATQIQTGDTTALARGITLVESLRDDHWELAKELLKKVYDPKRVSQRIGFSGPPGVGKSTFIEKLGLKLIENKSSVAVLAVDPSSQITGGSILGDKTRMEELSRHKRAFVRPSPSRGHLGGVTSTLPAVLILCEAAGFDWILIESVGVGQSEVELHSMVDHFTLIAQPGAGDELQGIKKGILEYVDHIVVNKSDMDPQVVNLTKQQYLAALKIMRGKDIPVYSCSALKGVGFDELRDAYEQYFKSIDPLRRQEHFFKWLKSLMVSQFERKLRSDQKWKTQFDQMTLEVKRGEKLPFESVDQFFSLL